MAPIVTKHHLSRRARNSHYTAGIPARSESNVNPFFKDYDHEYEKKGQQIAVAEAQNRKRSIELTGRARAPSSPRRGLGLGLETNEDSRQYWLAEKMAWANQESKATGILNRMKSLKGGRRAQARATRDQWLGYTGTRVLESAFGILNELD